MTQPPQPTAPARTSRGTLSDTTKAAIFADEELTPEQDAEYRAALEETPATLGDLQMVIDTLLELLPEKPTAAAQLRQAATAFMKTDA